ncbi:hypothetical protein MITS9509_02107 [Synechococcus sp. MIT S9509]|uniref:C2 family cysteine protease n=1 Tax=Synechococcus sp. MIT S9509 TaxID=1801630 RepID=UPI0007BBD91E|nr:C2 family cysteine protease [Synechococcus sp. MIT S9509]KZR91775.1 hypothetical protein MITS9509_02107 [Synechococcus sp. MIT S9509]
MEDLNTAQLFSTSGKTDDIISASSSEGLRSNFGYGFEQNLNNYSDNNLALPLISGDTGITVYNSSNEQALPSNEGYRSVDISGIIESSTKLTDEFETSQTSEIDSTSRSQSTTSQDELNSSHGWVEKEGNTSLYKYWRNYYVHNEDGYTFINYTDSNDWSLIGAEKVNEINQIAFENPVSDEFYRYNMDSDWNPVNGDYLTGASLYQAESDFGQDFNNDSTIGSPNTVVESEGFVELQKDSFGMGWVKHSDGSTDDITQNGLRVGSSGAWSQVAAETINGQNKVIWMHSNGLMSEWNVNSNWDFQNLTVHQAGSNSFLNNESGFNIDFNNDSTIGSPNTVVESEGSIELQKDSFGMGWVKHSDGSTDDITQNSLRVGSSGAWSQVAAETINGQNKVIWMHSNGLMSEWNVDSNWDFQNLTVHQAESNSFLNNESCFNIDFNNDSTIGSPNTVVESEGSIELQKDSFGMGWVKHSDGSTDDITQNSLRVGSSGAWSQVAAETINGQNKVIWMHSNGLMSEWNVDSNWDFQNLTVHQAGSNSFLNNESYFNTDFNNDSIVGGTNKISGISNSSILNNINISLSDDLFTHQELKSLLNDVASGGVTATELTDLQTIETNLDGYLSATEASYQNYIFDAVVNGNTANQWWTGGESSRISLGNLAEGSTEAHLNSLIDKWYGGLDRPTNFVQGDSAASASAMSFDYYEMVGDLFVDGVDFDDIRQGQAGTCYVLAAACSYADADSSIITEMFKDNGDGTYGVRFYDNSLSEVWVTVDSYVPSTNGYSTALAGNASWGLTGEKWVALLEKGYAQANETGAFSRGSDSSKNSYAAVEGGWMDALTHLSGNTSTTVSLNYTGTGDSGTGLNGWTNAWGSQTSWNSFESQAIAALNNNKALWLGSFGNTWGSNGKRDFVAGHAFAITAYDASTGLFTIVNPWGSSSGSSNHNFTARWSELATYGLDPIVSWA